MLRLRATGDRSPGSGAVRGIGRLSFDSDCEREERREDDCDRRSGRTREDLEEHSWQPAAVLVNAHTCAIRFDRGRTIRGRHIAWSRPAQARAGRLDDAEALGDEARWLSLGTLGSSNGPCRHLT